MKSYFERHKFVIGIALGLLLFQIGSIVALLVTVGIRDGWCHV